MFRFADCAWVEEEAQEETEERKGEEEEEKVKEREEQPAWDAVRQKEGHRRIVSFGEGDKAVILGRGH